MEKDRWVIEWKNDWEQLYFRKKWNWYILTFIHIEFDNDMFTGGLEFDFVLLGLGFHLRYNRDAFFEKEKEWSKDIEETLGELDKSEKV